MTAQKFDIEIEQGADLTLTLTYKDELRVPVDLTGCDSQMQVREAVGGRILSSLSTANGRITVNAEGEICARISHLETLEIQVVQAVYDLFLHFPDTDIREKLVYGDAPVSPAVTR